MGGLTMGTIVQGVGQRMGSVNEQRFPRLLNAQSPVLVLREYGTILPLYRLGDFRKRHGAKMLLSAQLNYHGSGEVYDEAVLH